MSNKLYRAYSLVDDHPDLGNVCFAWFYHLRKKPVAPYQDLIEGYHALNEAEKGNAKRDLNELFTDDEAQAVGAYLKHEYGFESFLIEKPLPLNPKDMTDEATLKIERDTGAIYMLAAEPGYSLPFEVWAYYHLLGDWKAEKTEPSNIISRGKKKIAWLASDIFRAFPKAVTGLVFYILGCGCIYYQRKFVNGDLDHKIGIYRDAEDEACEACMAMAGAWKNRVIDETVVYNCKFQVKS